MAELTKNGLMFELDCTRYDGAEFILFPFKDSTKEEIKAAVEEIRQQHDVLKLSVHRLEFTKEEMQNDKNS